MKPSTHLQHIDRQDELDFLKCLLILLMISFHLVYIGDSFPYAKKVVYTFHMPGFLLISGYVMNIMKPSRQFMQTILWWAIPYLIMESGYVVMASLLPIREHIDVLTLPLFMHKLLVDPLGPYWYLHTVIICGLTYYVVFHVVKLSDVSRFILLAMLFFIYGRVFHLVSFSHAMYFMAGAVIRHCSTRFSEVVRPSLWSLAAFALLIICPALLDTDTLGGLLIVYAALSGLQALFPCLSTRLRSLTLYLGRNTLVLFLFSPIFTILCKPLAAWLQFDPTAMLFLIISLLICVAGSLAIAWLMDTLHLSRWFFGKEKVLAKYPSHA